jgi:hypothetical protein
VQQAWIEGVRAGLASWRRSRSSALFKVRRIEKIASCSRGNRVDNRRAVVKAGAAVYLSRVGRSRVGHDALPSRDFHLFRHLWAALAVEVTSSRRLDDSLRPMTAVRKEQVHPATSMLFFMGRGLCHVCDAWPAGPRRARDAYCSS